MAGASPSATGLVGLRPEPAAQSRPSGDHPLRERWHGVLAAARALEVWSSNGLSHTTNRVLAAAASDLRRNAALIARDAALLVTQDAETLRDSDGSGEAIETGTGSTEGDSAGPKGIARNGEA